MTNEELDSVMAKAKEQFRKGEPLFGKNGAFHFMLENFLNSALETEMSGELVSYFSLRTGLITIQVQDMIVLIPFLP